MTKKKGKRETYWHRWIREHPRVTLYLDKGIYDRIKELAAKKGMSVKEFILSVIEDFRRYYDDIAGRERSIGFQDGYDAAITDFYEMPWSFYEEFKKRYPNVEPALFTIPCPLCGEPMVFHHRKDNWLREIRPLLLKAFRDWRHVQCPRSSKS
jgi:hypothetical protein